MIEDVAGSLAVALPGCTAEEIADVLWLASSRQVYADTPQLLPSGDEPSTLPGVPTPVTAAPEPTETMHDADRFELVLAPGGGPVLGDRTSAATAVGLRAPIPGIRPLSTARVFSSFKRIHGPGPPVIDIDATIEATADARRLVVVSRPERERGLDVALVVDTSPVMTACDREVVEFESLLRQAGAFRSVSRWSLAPTRPDQPLAGGRPNGFGAGVVIRDSAGVEHHPDRLLDPAGRRLVLIATDAVADHWYGPAVWRVLGRWARVMPTAAIHLLPDQYRAQSALGGSTIAMRSRRPAGPNSAADIETAWWDTDAEATTVGSVPMPVVAMSPETLAIWAQSVTAGTAWVDAVWTRWLPGPSPREANARFSAEERVRAFQARASRGAQALARILAGGPILSWPLISVLQARLLPHTGTSELAEVLVAGLLERASAPTGGIESEHFRFRPMVGGLLRRGTTTMQQWDTFETISDYLVENAGIGDAVHALLADPRGITAVDATLEPFAAFGRSVAARLGLRLGNGVDVSAAETVGTPRLPLVLRRAADSDFAAIIRLNDEASRWLRTKNTDQWAQPWPDRRQRDQRIMAAIRAGRTWIVWDGDQPAATITASPEDNGIWPEDSRGEPAVYISRLVVSRRYAGQALGAQLLDWAGLRASSEYGAHWIRVDAWTTNTKLHDYLRGLGFQFHGFSEIVSDYPSAALFQKPIDEIRRPERPLYHEPPSDTFQRENDAVTGPVDLLGPP